MMNSQLKQRLSACIFARAKYYATRSMDNLATWCEAWDELMSMPELEIPDLQDWSGLAVAGERYTVPPLCLHHAAQMDRGGV